MATPLHLACAQTELYCGVLVAADIWAVFLWSYRVSGFAPFLERAQAALGIMMAGYPSQWIPTSNGIAMQRARIILPLAFLVRANDTALHRQWLHTAIDGLMSRQHCEGGTWCAFKEELSHPGWAKGTRVPDNADYGTFEAPLNQGNDDPVRARVRACMHVLHSIVVQ